MALHWYDHRAHMLIIASHCKHRQFKLILCSHYLLIVFVYRGFCYFNNVAIVAKMLKRNYNLERILIVDWVIEILFSHFLF